MNNLQPFFSVIIPYYNTLVGDIERAVFSVADQATNGVSIEIVAIDDGCDAPFAVPIDKFLDQIANTSRLTIVRLRHQANYGLARTRNSGIDSATGKFVIFLDSDDWLLPGSLAKLKPHLQDQNPDLALIQSSIVFDYQPNKTTIICSADQAIATAFDQNANKNISPNNFVELSLTISSCAQVYRLNFLNDPTLRFDPVLTRWEDRPFVVESQLRAKNLAIIPVILRAYCVPDRAHVGNSITRSSLGRNDAILMARHINAVKNQLAVHKNSGISGYEVQHFWQSVARFYSVIGGASYLKLFSDHKMRDAVVSAASCLSTWKRELGTNLPQPLAATNLGGSHRLLRGFLIFSLGGSGNIAGLLNLQLLFLLAAIYRRLWRANNRKQ